MKLEKGAELSDGRVIYWLGNLCINCVPSQDKRWHVGHFDRAEYESRWENTVALLKDEKFQFMVKVGPGLSVRARCVSINGTFVFSVHRDPYATMEAIIVLDAQQKEIFKLTTTTHLTACSLSEFAEYLALSFYGAPKSKEQFDNKLEVFNLKTGEVVSSINKDEELRHAEISVTEPDGNVVAFYKGKCFKVC
ncbi:hypothetical protein C1339_15265 [Salmonella enterica subsp. enterica serovar Montevideo]|uniref:hypothetical protein n=1 Tax=Salmonella enterica TaxID=28901 RepID=UPI001271C879|nr:hypothetical protein [Salmonella enterica]ECH4007766.1 hypothetical protein [Salmonella enterica subsp. enterica serovar Montevideo]EAM6223616.1 hypothetical protein [Salmonella enterica]EBA9153637.1 hypothetical protein [Salmonella enterica]EBO4030229.1 hypothetical protein [Salmonella enterica]ECE3574403.1 hypothetical protein [Salmonella enterica]